jgi:hypothetical protein
MTWSISVSNHQSSSGETSAATMSVDSNPTVNEGAPIGFFAIGIAVNVVLIVAYFIWAARQWKKPGARDKS